MQAVPPGAVGHHAAGEVIDDDDLAVADDVVLVLEVQFPGDQGLGHQFLPAASPLPDARQGGRPRPPDGFGPRPSVPPPDTAD